MVEGAAGGAQLVLQGRQAGAVAGERRPAIAVGHVLVALNIQLDLRAALGLDLEAVAWLLPASWGTWSDVSRCCSHGGYVLWTVVASCV